MSRVHVGELEIDYEEDLAELDRTLERLRAEPKAPDDGIRR